MKPSLQELVLLLAEILVVLRQMDAALVRMRSEIQATLVAVIAEFPKGAT